MSSKVGRAKPLSRDERRAVIMDAALPLLLAHGRDVTSRQLAEAAGVAEGTLYSVFDDKDEIVRASVERRLDAASMRGALAEIDSGLALQALIEAIVELTQHRTQEVFALIALMGFHERRPGSGGHERHRPDNEPVIQAISDLLTPHRAELTVTPRRAAQFIRLATFSMTHPLMTDGDVIPAPEIAELLLNGFTARPDSYGQPTAATPVLSEVL